MKKKHVMILVVSILLITTNITWAHRPLDTDGPATREEPIVVSNHKLSWAAYNRLTKPNDADYYRFQAQQGDKIFASLLVPEIDRLKGFNPDLALIGPGLDSDYARLSPTEIAAKLNFSTDEGVIIKQYSKSTSEVFFEPFTQTSYWQKQKLIITAPTTGTYYLTVFSNKEEVGKYVLAIGQQEQWEIKDIIKFPKIWWNVRQFAEKKISTYLILVLLLSIIILAIKKIIF
ncbi:hypothetical protein [Halanaerobacter jeridensis]|uniref:Uncharacterized protein n=1 Tax=Halanaerobacter jeridensis TaxID=706427 RepID=A0A939BP99_9FIRM|nr:hypothetical protein [Halanaerobacter jeridensis]MBM7556762.1 hypothetical protein [Halanaerobacter jeridensis]